MTGEKNISRLIRSMKPVLNEGEFVFCSFNDVSAINMDEVVCLLKEPEGISVILPKKTADDHRYPYSYIASWITLSIHSSLEAVGLTAAASKALAEKNISCNVVAGYYHDHIFVARKDGDKAMRILSGVGSRDRERSTNH